VLLFCSSQGAIVVFDDVQDLDAAARWVAYGIFLTTGQVCSATSRLLVHEAIADDLTARVVALANAVVVGHPLNPATTM
jgi:acyl-CoA reductase-like NAD-dependent aldehyde dehydrogenase